MHIETYTALELPKQVARNLWPDRQAAYIRSGLLYRLDVRCLPGSGLGRGRRFENRIRHRFRFGYHGFCGW